MLTIITWYWQQPDGRAKYTAFDVNFWAAKVRQNLTIPHRIACVTRHTEGIDRSIDIITPPTDFEHVRIPTWGEHLPQCLRRLAMFRPDAERIFGKRFVCMDLDSLPCGPLDPLFEEDVDFRICRGTSSERPYNGSMIQMEAGSRPQVYNHFTPEGAAEAGRKFVGSDQAWISHILGWGERTWSAEHGVHFWPKALQSDEQDRRVVFFAGRVKPRQAAERNEWVRSHYCLPPREGKCLILGYADCVWRDAEAALSRETFDFVIAAPEVAEVWPGHVDAIAADDDEAEHIARMHGFTAWEFCGRQAEAA